MIGKTIADCEDDRGSAVRLANKVFDYTAHTLGLHTSLDMALLDHFNYGRTIKSGPDADSGPDVRRCARLILMYGKFRSQGEVLIPPPCRAYLMELERELDNMDDSDVMEGLRWRCSETTCTKET